MKHLVPEFDLMRRRYPAEAASSLVLPCLRRIQEDRGFVADSDIAELAAYIPVPRIQIVTIEAAMQLRDRAVRLPARRDDGFKRAVKEADAGAQGALDL